MDPLGQPSSLLKRKGSGVSSGSWTLPRGHLLGLLVVMVISQFVIKYYDLFSTLGWRSVLVTVCVEMTTLISHEIISDPSQLKQRREEHEWLSEYSTWSVVPNMRHTRDILVPSRGDHQVPVRLYTPEVESVPVDGLPLLVWVHGGGWVIGSIKSDDKMARMLAQSTGAIVASVEYRLAPETKYPGQLEDVMDVMYHLLDEGHRYGADKSRLGIAGESAGAHLSIVSALSLASERPESLCGLISIVPATVYGCVSQSCNQYGSGIVLHKKHVQSFWNATVPFELVDDPIASPLRAPHHVLSRLPSTLLLTAEADPLRDEGEAFYAKAKHSGAAIEHTRYNRTMHAFFARLATGGAESLEQVSRFFQEKCVLTAPPSIRKPMETGAL